MLISLYSITSVLSNCSRGNATFTKDDLCARAQGSQLKIHRRCSGSATPIICLHLLITATNAAQVQRLPYLRIKLWSASPLQRLVKYCAKPGLHVCLTMQTAKFQGCSQCFKFHFNLGPAPVIHISSGHNTKNLVFLFCFFAFKHSRWD